MENDDKPINPEMSFNMNFHIADVLFSKQLYENAGISLNGLASLEKASNLSGQVEMIKEVQKKAQRSPETFQI